MLAFVLRRACGARAGPVRPSGLARGRRGEGVANVKTIILAAAVALAVLALGRGASVPNVERATAARVAALQGAE